MKLIPILFSTPMVQAILDGRKTMTRRIIKSKHESGLFRVGRNKSDRAITEITSLDWDENPVDPSNDIQPKWKVGDILWVRESFGWDWINYPERTNKYYFFKASTPANFLASGEHWKPSIHMPYDACRIWLIVTGVRVERLHDISPDDAVNEGIEYDNIDHNALEGGELVADYKNYMWRDDEKYEDYHFPTYADPIRSFMSLWEKINGSESLKSNSWAWVVEFEKTEKPSNQ